MKSLYIYFLFLFISFVSIKSLDITLNLGKMLDNGNFPLIVTLKDPLIEETSPIDLFCVFDLSGSMGGARLSNLKAALNLIIEALDSNDRLSLIEFESNSKTITELSYMTKEEKIRQTNIVNGLRASGGTVFRNPIREFLRGIRNSYSPNNGRVQSVIFCTDGNSFDGRAKTLFLSEYKSNENYDFTVHTFLIGDEGKSEPLMEFSDFRDGSFYYINKLDNIRNYVLNVIGSLRSTSYKHLNLEIKSPYPIAKFYDHDKISVCSFKPNCNQFSMQILQFITGHEYTYVLEVKLPGNIGVGDDVLKASASYQDFYGGTHKAYNYIDFYHPNGCFNCYREEYCRAKAVEAIEQTINNKGQRESKFRKVIDDCGTYLNSNISKSLNEIMNMDSASYIYGVISEASLKRGGMNLWFSNDYQYELIADFIYNRNVRHLWERFHIPYWKLSFLRRIRRATGVPLNFIYILFITLITIPLSFISTFALKGTGRLIFNMIAGLIIQIALFDVAFLNVFLSCCVVYLLLRFTKIHGGPILFILFGYLIGVHIFHFIFYGQTLDFGASPFLFMFAIAKITFFTYAVRERNVSPIHFINQYHRYCIVGEKFPNFAEFLSYIYFFPSAIYGPSFQIKDYLNYIYGREEYQNINYRRQLLEAFIRIIVGYGLIVLYYVLKYSNLLQFGMFKVYQYIASDDILSVNVALRFLLIYAWNVYIKFFIYGFFQLIYGIFMTTGIAYSEEVVLPNLKGGNDFVLDVSDKKGHCGRILKSDFGYNIGDTINHFNRSIHIYLKYCVYIRILFLRNSWIKNYFIAAIFVFIFAALWCGIYVGIYFFFATACIIYQCHFNLELMGFYDWLEHSHIILKIIFTILVQYLMSMVFCMLFLYKLDMVLCYLQNFYYVPVGLVVVLYVISLLLRIFKFKITIPLKDQRDRSKTRGRKAGKEGLLKSNK